MLCRPKVRGQRSEGLGAHLSTTVENGSLSERTPLLNGGAVSSRDPTVEFRQTLRHKTPSLMRVIVKVFGPMLLLANTGKLFADALMFAGPLLQR